MGSPWAAWVDLSPCASLGRGGVRLGLRGVGWGRRGRRVAGAARRESTGVVRVGAVGRRLFGVCSSAFAFAGSVTQPHPPTTSLSYHLPNYAP
jgi:hypothetical protein